MRTTLLLLAMRNFRALHVLPGTPTIDKTAADVDDDGAVRAALGVLRDHGGPAHTRPGARRDAADKPGPGRLRADAGKLREALEPGDSVTCMHLRSSTR